MPRHRIWILAAAVAGALNGFAGAPPKEVPIMEKALTLTANGQNIPAMLSVPEGGPAEWGIVLIPGSFANDVDGNYSTALGSPFAAKPHMYKDLARQLAGRGCVVLRYARGGATTVDAAETAAHRHFSDRTIVVAEAVRALRAAVPGLAHCALAGHSEGGPVALLYLSGRADAGIDAYVSLSAPARRIFDIMLQQIEPSVKDGFWSFGALKFPFAGYKLAMDLIRRGEAVPESLKKTLPPFGVHTMDAVSRNYLREYDRIDSPALLAALACPVLIVQGGRDTSVFPDNAEALFNARKGNPAVTDKAIFPELQHFYKKCPPGLDPNGAFALETDSDPAVADGIAAWLRKIARHLSP
jgi:pimeloyl-ACP methyl ester carboxylesterase